MIETPFQRGWRSLRNPFQGRPETGEMIVSHVSGRSGDIQNIVMGGPGALILSGVPRIGKTSLLRYLQQPPIIEWSWRDELEDQIGSSSADLDEIFFTQISLTPLEGLEQSDALLEAFITQCTTALQAIGQAETADYRGRKGLRELLRSMTRNHPSARYFVILDAIERLQGPDMPALPVSGAGGAQTAQERALNLLNHCGAFRLLVDLLDEFTHFGVILSIESLPSPNISNQFRHISIDLARFSTMTLQTFTREGAMQYLAQQPEDFGAYWAQQFRDAGGNVLFSVQEQEWLYEQAGAHPYLLQQFCYQLFQLKCEYTIKYGSWTELPGNDRDQLIEYMNHRMSTFFDAAWRRIKKALDISSPQTRNTFYDFIESSSEKRATEEIDPDVWNQLGLELRYILPGEGIVRSDLLQPVYYPGSMLLHALAQKAQSQGTLSTPALQPQSATTNRQLAINIPGKQPVELNLSTLEYRLMKTLIEHPDRCTEEVLMKASWGSLIEKSVLTQRLHHLRKKLRDLCNDEEMIENRYGGIYRLNHAEWLRLL